jgi:hypothetical protein
VFAAATERKLGNVSGNLSVEQRNNKLKMKFLSVLFITVLVSTKAFSQSDKLIGVWDVFFDENEVTNFECKTCPKWEFKANKTLTFTRYDGKQETTTWEIDKNGTLNFGKTLKGFQGTVENKMSKLPVKMIFTKKGIYTELRFSHKGKKTPIILRKK